MNMKQDRRLYVKNLIMNDPETVKVTSNETAFCSTNYANDILGNLSRGTRVRLAWCTMSPPPSPPAPYVWKCSAASELGPKNDLYS